MPTTAELRIHTEKAELLHGSALVVVERDLTHAALEAYYRVYNRLGFGFAERVYVQALALELQRAGHEVQLEAPITVTYDGVVIGSYRADMLVDSRLIIEVKADSHILTGAERQLMNYLRCSELEVGLLLSFGLKPRFRRLIHTRDRKLVTNE